MQNGLDTSTLQAGGLLKIVKKRLQVSIDHRANKRILGASVDDWLGRCDRMLNKEHDPDQIAGHPGMKRYFGLATMRSMAVTAWMRDLLVNAGDVPITASPTPMPDLNQDAQAEIEAELLAITAQKFAEAGIDPFQPTAPPGIYGGKKGLGSQYQANPAVSKWLREQSAKLFDTKRELVRKKASQSMDRMLVKIRDYALQGGFHQAHEMYLHHGNVYPYKVLCGPDWQEVTMPQWKGGKYVYKNVMQPTWRAVDPNSAYFAPDSTSASDGGWFIEKIRRSRAAIVGLRNNKVYNKTNIDKLLVSWVSDGPPVEEFSSELMDSLCHQLAIDDMVEGYRHVGIISGRELSAANVNGYDQDKSYNVDIEWFGDHIIKVKVVAQPSGMRGYYSTSFKRLGDSWAGASPMMLLHDAQITLNQWQYGINQNFYAASGSMLEVNGGMIESAADWHWKPFGAFTTNQANRTALNQKALEMHNMPFNAGAMFNLFMHRLRLADYECGIPSEAYGPSLPVGGQQTLGEITLRWGASLRGIKDSILNDDVWVIEKTFQHLYQQLMQYEDDPAIKDGGDTIIKAKGASGLLQKEMMEVQRERLMPTLQQAAQAFPNEYGDAFRATLNDQFKAMGVDSSVLPPDPAIAAEGNSLLRGIAGTPSLRPDGRSAIPTELQT